MTVDPTLLYQVRYLVAKGFSVRPEDVAAETHFYRDLDACLDLAEVVMSCEEHWDVSLPKDTLEHLETVGQLAEMISAALAEKTSAGR